MLHIALIVLAGIVVYSNTLHVPLVMDDEHISSFGQKSLLETLLHGGARRVADFTFVLGYQIHGLQVTGYHLVNLAIHLTSAVTLYFVIVSALASLRTSFPPSESALEESLFVDKFSPLVTALLFVTHPLQTQAVTYIIQRYTSLATFLYLLSVLFFLKGRLSYAKSGASCRLWLLGAISLMAGTLAMGCKQIAATLPVMLVFLEIFLFRGRLLNRKFFFAFGAFFIIGLIFVLIKWHDSSIHDLLYYLHQATSENTQISRTTYFLTQTRVVVTYLRLLLLPFDQSLVHDAPVYTKLSLPVIVALGLHIFLGSIALFLFKRSRSNLLSDNWVKGLLQRMVSLGIIWFYTAMAVESSIFPIKDVIFEHRIYLPSVGFFITITAGMALAVRVSQLNFKATWGVIAVLCLVLGCLTVARNRVWNDTLTLYQDAASKAPDNVLAVANLGDEYLLRNMPGKALPYLLQAIELEPNLDGPSVVYLGEALRGLNLDDSRFTTGKEYVLPDGAVYDYRFTGVAFNNMGLAYELLGYPEKALQSYRKAIRVLPGYDLAWYNLGLLSTRLGDKEQVAAALDKLKTLNPSLAGSLASAWSR